MTGTRSALKRTGIAVCKRVGPHLPGTALQNGMRRHVVRRLMDQRVLPAGLRPCPTRECATPLLVDPYIFTHHTIFWCRRLYEQHTAEFLRRWLSPGAVAIDIGMNLGHFTTLASQIVGDTGRVIAFEPNPRLCERVRAHLAACGVTNVEVRNLALGPADSEVRLAVPADTGSAFVEEITGRSPSHGVTHFTVGMRQGDEEMASVQAERLILKIDVEGAEFDVLDGLRGTLGTRVVAGQVEVSPDWLGPAKLRAIQELLRGCGFTTYLAARGPRLRPVVVSEIRAQCDVWFVREQPPGVR